MYSPILSLSLLNGIVATTGGLDASAHSTTQFQVGASVLVAEGGAIPALHLGLDHSLASWAALELRLDSLGLLNMLSGSFVLPLLCSTEGHSCFTLRQSQIGVHAADFFGGHLLVGAVGGGAGVTVGWSAASIAVGLEALLLVGDQIGGRNDDRASPLDLFTMAIRPTLQLEVHSPGPVRPFAEVSGLATSEFLLANIAVGVAW